MNKKTNPLQLKTLAISICLTFTASAYASNDHGSNHVENSHHDSNHGNSASGGSESKLKSYLIAVNEPLAQGEVKLEQKTSKTEFSAEVKIPVPSTALNVADITAATDATLTLVLRDNLGADYAECNVDLNKIKTVANRRVSILTAEYKVKITDRNGFLQANGGVCDIDLNASGIQSGVPMIQIGDTAEITIDTNGATIGTGSF
ncbi:hypothetical protein ABXJ76_05225 [Methylobacter sp. G7]|uniref:hypothetical protein n=1 Tax=Methylobacter sp. G7 TaxID=3230117 RepID=UPI003D808C93